MNKKAVKPVVAGLDAALEMERDEEGLVDSETHVDVNKEDGVNWCYI